MEKNLEKTLSNFLNEPQVEEEKTKKNENTKKIILDEREGLIERIDRQYVTSDGRILLREQY